MALRRVIVMPSNRILNKPLCFGECYVDVFMFGEDIRHRLTSVVQLRPAIKEFLKHVDELIILLNIDSGVLDNQASIGMKSLSYSFTVLELVGLAFEEGLDINDRYR